MTLDDHLKQNLSWRATDSRDSTKLDTSLRVADGEGEGRKKSCSLLEKITQLRTPASVIYTGNAQLFPPLVQAGAVTSPSSVEPFLTSMFYATDEEDADEPASSHSFPLFGNVPILMADLFVPLATAPLITLPPLPPRPRWPRDPCTLPYVLLFVDAIIVPTAVLPTEAGLLNGPKEYRNIVNAPT
ncbi:hypothetical protein E2C01_039658 [Portunus trituberculatus]|uniref:Uncharacterized protein n=1 Tax=Portunus trituberculatus TaxID=210409 RepID=A0A5B7FFA6_PORTR|nr:hypothetical protein [Portunus trituberculatus]